MSIYGSRGCDIILLIGDSNTRSGLKADATAGYDPAIDVQNSRCLEYRNSSRPGVGKKSIIVAQEPIFDYSPNANPNPTAIGAALTAMRDWWVPSMLASDRNVMVVACAEGGTGFISNGYWCAGNLGPSNATDRVNEAIAADARNAIKVILFTSGANDGNGSNTQSAYTASFVGMVAQLRANITGGTNVPILVQPLVPAYVVAVPTAGPVNLAQAALPSNVSKCGYMDPTGMGLTGQTAINYHHTAASHRIMGSVGWANAWAAMSA